MSYKPATNQDGSGTGCNGNMHSRSECRVCERRADPEFLYSSMRVAKDKHVFQISVANIIEQRLISFVILSCGTVVYLFWNGTLTTNPNLDFHNPIILIMSIIIWVIGLLSVHYSFFTTSEYVVDCDKRELAHSVSSLVGGSHRSIYPFADIALVCLDNFRDRKWKDGSLKSDNMRATAWIKINDNRILSFGSGDPVTARAITDKLHELFGVELEVTDAANSPTSDDWTWSST